MNSDGCFAGQCDWRLPTIYELQTILGGAPMRCAHRHDELQGRGIGRYLLGRLTAIARERSIRSFIAYVLPANTRVLNVCQHARLAMDSRLEKSVYTVTLRLA